MKHNKQQNQAVNASEQVTKELTPKQKAAQEKRLWLMRISADFQAQRQLMELMGAETIPTINEMLRAYYAKQNNITELNTYDQWKEKGYQVKKGEKALLFWGKPRNKKQAEQAETQDEQTEQQQAELEAIKDDYYPICYLFDISQCHKIGAEA